MGRMVEFQIHNFQGLEKNKVEEEHAANCYHTYVQPSLCVDKQ